MDVVKGKVWKFGDDINTDVIAPGKYMNMPVDEMKKHTLEIMNPQFPNEVKKGDVIVGGNNFGCGSSREEAPAALKACGVAAVIAESFARIFFRNAIAIGLPVVACNGISNSFKEGDTLELNLDLALVTCIDTGTVLTFEPLSDEIKAILAGGGIVTMLKEIAGRQNRV